MDPAQGESGGGKSLTSKLMAKVPHPRVKGKVKNLKNLLPGMKKHNSEDEAHEDSSEYDENSPRGSGAETGYNVGDSTPFTTGKTTPDSNSPRVSPPEVHNPDYDARPAGQTGYDAHYVAAPPTRPAPPATDSPRSNLAPTLEEKFQYLDVRDKTTPPQAAADFTPIDRSHRPEQHQSYSSSPYTPSDRSYQPKQQSSSDLPSTPIDHSYEPKPQQPSSYSTSTPIDHSYEPKPQQPSSYSASTPIDRSYEPKQQQPSSYSPTTESVQKGYSDDPRNSYRSTTTPSPTNKGMLDKVKETVAGATAVLGDKMGYYNDHAPADPNAPSIFERAKSTLGVDKPRDPNAPPLTERAKSYMTAASQKTREYSTTAADRAAWTKDRVAAQTTPTHHDKALSEQVTQSLSSLPAVLKERVFGPASPSANSPTSPSIVNRVSGAVSSLFTSPPKDTFPAHSDYNAAPADRSTVPERMPANSASAAYPTVNN